MTTINYENDLITPSYVRSNGRGFYSTVVNGRIRDMPESQMLNYFDWKTFECPVESCNCRIVCISGTVYYHLKNKHPEILKKLQKENPKARVEYRKGRYIVRIKGRPIHMEESCKHGHKCYGRKSGGCPYNHYASVVNNLQKQSKPNKFCRYDWNYFMRKGGRCKNKHCFYDHALGRVDYIESLQKKSIKHQATNGNANVPITNEDVDVPITNGDAVIPVSNEDVDVPVSNGDVDVPVSNGDVVVLVSNEDAVVPVSNEDVVIPVSNEDVDVPVSNEDDAVPVLNENA